MLEPDPENRLLRELSVLLKLFPLSFSDLSLPLASRVHASHASELGAGLVYANLSTSAL